MARENSIPVIGNGDILTWYEAEDRLLSSNMGQPHHVDPVTGLRSGVAAMMAGRGALIKPWIFKEWADKKSWQPSAQERVGIYWRLAGYFKDHFGSDDFGKRHAFYFLPWHLGFFCRHRELPENVFGNLSLSQPLISTRWDSVVSPELGETLETLPILERLLRCEHETAHQEMSAVLWESESDSAAVLALEKLAAENVVRWEEEVRMSGDGRDDNRESEG